MTLCVCNSTFNGDIAFNKVSLPNQDESGRVSGQIQTDDIQVPCARIIYRMPYCAVFLLNGPVHAQRSFLRIREEPFKRLSRLVFHFLILNYCPELWIQLYVILMLDEAHQFYHRKQLYSAESIF